MMAAESSATLVASAGGWNVKSASALASVFQSLILSVYCGAPAMVFCGRPVYPDVMAMRNAPSRPSGPGRVPGMGRRT